MNQILTNKKGVTILEGLIALGLLALVAAGTFGVLLSVSHKASQPDLREEMVYAVEKANDLLQMYAQEMSNPNTSVATGIQQGLCGGVTLNQVIDTTPLSEGEHEIPCLLPVICDPDTSTFNYTVDGSNVTLSLDTDDGKKINRDNYQVDSGNPTAPMRRITFNITCNGFTL